MLVHSRDVPFLQGHDGPVIRRDSAAPDICDVVRENIPLVAERQAEKNPFIHSTITFYGFLVLFNF